MVRNILVAVDGSIQARKAIDIAADVALGNDAVIYLLFVVLPDSEVPEEVREFIRAERSEDPAGNVYMEVVAEKIIQAAEKQLKEKGVKEVRSFVAQGDPAEKIIKFAREHDIDMVVMGSHGYSAAMEMVLGSVSRKVCHSLAECTCVIVK